MMNFTKKLMLSFGLLCASRVVLCNINQASGQSGIDIKVFGLSLGDVTLNDSADTIETGSHILGCGFDAKLSKNTTAAVLLGAAAFHQYWHQNYGSALMFVIAATIFSSTTKKNSTHLEKESIANKQDIAQQEIA